MLPEHGAAGEIRFAVKCCAVDLGLPLVLHCVPLLGTLNQSCFTSAGKQDAVPCPQLVGK